MSPATLEALAQWLEHTLGEPDTLKRPGISGIRTLALALESRDLPGQLPADAAFLHRSRGVGDRWLGLGIVGVHDGFDLHLTTGPNRRLAARLGWRDVQDVTWEGRIVGISATPPQRDWAEVRAALHTELGGEDSSFPPAEAASPAEPGPPRLALMNAMNPALLAHVAGQGVTVYLTGQLRPSAVAAAQALGLGVVALGHHRTELWGLGQLARELEAAFPGLKTVMYR